MSFPPLAGACDCHFHIMDRKFPVVAGAQVPNLEAPVARYVPFAREIGTERGVIIQPSLYGTNNACTLAALAALGGRGRAIVVIDEATPIADLERWHALGVRGIRFNQVQAGATTMEMLHPLAERIAPLGWHVQLHMKARELPAYAERLLSLPVPLVLDHMARLALPDFAKDPGWEVVLRLLEKGRTWVKLSGPYHENRAGAPEYDHAVALGRDLVRRAEERLLFGSDWPHVTESAPPAPEHVCRFLVACAETPARMQRILVNNPAALFGF